MFQEIQIDNKTKNSHIHNAQVKFHIDISFTVICSNKHNNIDVKGVIRICRAMMELKIENNTK